MLLAGPASAQTIRDDVTKHVEESLEGQDQDDGNKNKKKKKKKKPPKSQGDKKGPHPSGSPSDDGTTLLLTPPVQGGPKLPLRVMHEYFQLDLNAGVGYRGWLPQQYPTVGVSMAHYFTWSVSLKARLFKVVNISRAYYESNKATAFRTSELSSAAKWGSLALKAAWFLAELGIPILDAWEPSVRYEARAFETHAKPKSGSEVCVIPFTMSGDTSGCVAQTEPITVISSYEIAALGVRYHPHKDASAVMHPFAGWKPKFFFGGAYMSYVKPYQVTVGESVLDKYLFTGRFHGGGLALGLTMGGGPNNVFIDVWAQMGLGRVRLTRDMTLNEVAPEDWLIGYVQGNATVSFQWAPFKFAPTILIVPAATVSGASFHFVKKVLEEGETVNMPSVNWDLLYNVSLNVVLTL